MDGELLPQSRGPCCRLPVEGCVRLGTGRVRQQYLIAGLAVVCLLYVLHEARVLDMDPPPTKTWQGVDDVVRLREHSPLEDPLAAAGPSCQQPAAGSPWLVNTQGCRLVAHDAFSPEVKSLIRHFGPVVCADPPPLVRSNDTHLVLDRTLLRDYNATDAACCFTPMWRAEGPRWQDDRAILQDGVSHGNDIRFGSTCEPFEDAVEMRDEFVRVTCSAPRGSGRGAPLYKDYHAFVPAKRPRGQTGPASPRELVSENALSILVVGIDSLSRLNMIRKMPRTLAYLEEKLGARSFLGYNKVEDNTFPNLVPLLSGLSVPELREACWPNDSTHFDACPWMWSHLRDRGYVNMFAEDTAWMGLFHYVKTGFVNQPTEYDARPMLYLGEKEQGRGGGFNAKYCIGQRHQVEMLLDYASKFVRSMASQRRKFFGLIWGTSLSHDELNQPEGADAFYERFLTDLEATGLFNSTAVVFMSDHGLRFGSILQTFQGHLENSLPVMYVMLPPWVRRRYPLAARNLECNRHKLVTVYDLHRTFYDLTDLSTLETARLSDRETGGPATNTSTPSKGTSLFRAIPASRTCNDAGIPINYCACQDLAEASLDLPGVQGAVKFLVDHINEMLSGQPQCAKVVLDQLLSARQGSPNGANVDPEALVNTYQVKFRTQPGPALYLATVRHHIKSDVREMAGSLTRLNAYGNSSWCASLASLRPLCFCTEPAPGSTAAAADTAAVSDGPRPATSFPPSRASPPPPPSSPAPGG